MGDAKKAPLWKIICYSLHNLGISISLLFVITIMMPAQIEDMVGQELKGIVLGVVSSFASILNAFGSLLFGIFSDHLKVQLPFIAIGTLVWSGSIVLRCAFVDKSIVMIVFYAIVTSLGLFAYGVAEAPFNAMLPRLFHPKQFGLVSGAVGFTLLIGTIVGVAGIGAIYSNFSIWIIAASVAVSTMFLCVFILPLGKYPFKRKSEFSNVIDLHELDSVTSEQSQEEGLEGNVQDDPLVLGGNVHSPANRRKCFPLCFKVLLGFFKPFKSRNYTLIVLVRIFMYISLSINQTYTLYFFDDMLKDYKVIVWEFIPKDDPTKALSIFMFVIVILSLVSSIVAGILSDHIGKRKYYIFVSGLLSSIVQLVLVFSRNYTAILAVSFISGIALGTFVSTDLALANEVLPSVSDAGRDLAIYSSAKTIPQLLATPLAGLILYLGNNLGKKIGIEGFGYYVIYTISSICAMLCAIIVLLIKEKSKKLKNRELALEIEILDNPETPTGDQSITDPLEHPMIDESLNQSTDDQSLNQSTDDQSRKQSTDDQSRKQSMSNLPLLHHSVPPLSDPNISSEDPMSSHEQEGEVVIAENVDQNM